MGHGFTDADWELLLHRIEVERCTPFLGAGACFGVLPLGGDIAREWAEAFDYPMQDRANLTGVAQYLALRRDPMFPKEKIAAMFEGLFEKGVAPDFDDPHEPHRTLAELPLPIYVTTNYDDYMHRALRRLRKNPRRELCRWNQMIKGVPSVFDAPPPASPANPVVFHLHGYTHRYAGERKVLMPESLVLTEDDYYDFLINLAGDPDLIPEQIQQALGGSSLLFVGYRLADSNFRVLLRSINRYREPALASTHFAVIPPPPDAAEPKEKVHEYLTSYYGNINVRVFWGTAAEFARELKGRWKNGV